MRLLSLLLCVALGTTLVAAPGAGPGPGTAAVVPNLNGHCSGGDWGAVELHRSAAGDSYAGTYTDTYGMDVGRIALTFSAKSGRYEGVWSEGRYRFGRLSVEVRDGGRQVQGVYSADPKCQHRPGEPARQEFQWQRDAK